MGSLSLGIEEAVFGFRQVKSSASRAYESKVSVASRTQSVTSVAVSPEIERRARMIKYLVAMGVRVVCIVLAVTVQGWLMWVFFAGAILLPYFAVVIANAQGAGGKNKQAATDVVAKPLTIDASAFVAASSQKSDEQP